MFKIHQNGQKKEKIVQQDLSGRCKEKISIFKITAGQVMKKVF